MVCYDYLPDGTGIIVGLSFYAILTAYSLLHCPLGVRFIFHIKWKHCEGKEASTIIFWPLWWQFHMCWRKWRYRTRIMKQVFRSERCFVNLLLGCVAQLLSFLMDKDIYLGNETNLVTHSNSEIIATVSCNCSANVRLLVSEGFINLMYFNPYPL